MSGASTASIKFTEFYSHVADRKKEKQAPLAEIAAAIRGTTAREKALLPWIKLATFGEARTDKGSLRHDANLLTITGVEADYDGGLVNFGTAHERLENQGLASIVYTSPGHAGARPRWRVLCPLSDGMPPSRRTHMMGRLNGLFGGIFAGESWTLSKS